MTAIILTLLLGLCLLAGWPRIQALLRVMVAWLPGLRVRQLCGLLLDGVYDLRGTTATGPDAFQYGRRRGGIDADGIPVRSALPLLGHSP